MNDRSRMMLYALTAVACVMWIWQSVKESMNDGTIISTSNIIFLVCIGIAAIYCAANALILWWRQPGKDDAADDDETDSTDAEAEAEQAEENEHDDVAVLRQVEQALASDDRAGRAGVPFALLISHNADGASSLHHDETGADEDDECPLDARPLRG